MSQVTSFSIIHGCYGKNRLPSTGYPSHGEVRRGFFSQQIRSSAQNGYGPQTVQVSSHGSPAFLTFQPHLQPPVPPLIRYPGLLSSLGCQVLLSWVDHAHLSPPPFLLGKVLLLHSLICPRECSQAPSCHPSCLCALHHLCVPPHV